MSVLVVGGAGYIGSHVVRLLRESGTDVVVVDDLSNGVPARIGDTTLEQIDISANAAPEALAGVIRREKVDAVIHFAAKKQVGESVERPLFYYQQNIGGLVNVLEAMRRENVTKMIFSSSASVYGAPEDAVVTEDSPTEPINPYGRSKLIGEWILADCERAWGLNWVALRYFNVAGAGWPELGDSVIMNLIPMVLDKLADGAAPRVFGDDYPTPDGTCIRDYVHVKDLAEAHIAALHGLDGQLTHHVFNVGTGRGSSVTEVIESIGRVSGLDTSPLVEGRRAGDPPKLIASADRIREDLGFVAKADLDEIVASAWEAWQAGPRRIEA
ncbi:UDP-glucose 4-epimerase GalE [Propionimicrobium sp. PCR01-08-3]|uniref:UDP-glucose 4-epimerase GalE n=1 Tax=Propionimicrobium sp. PCR01-08-3 TaxID=3052086 RepID=UPI00255CE2E6|nr:UDP-glucose 4-epimerase GalE [Propionimicrobium sp. PCR01-08-3]WIY82632.1 UDP-glucose 4-epimerase GalE [Propionimicrobium sp. PCR01-08-3]